MAEPAFTPGPWKVSRARCSYVGVMVLGWGRNYCITRCAVSGHIPRATSEANAALIAAAPVLYETLRSVIAFLNTQRPEPFDTAYGQAIEDGETALSLALGESPNA